MVYRFKHIKKGLKYFKFSVEVSGVRCQVFVSMVGEDIHFLNVMYLFSTRDPLNHISTKPIYLYLLHQYVRPFPQSHTEYGHADQDIEPGKPQIGFTVAGSLQTPGGERSNLEVTIHTETSKEREVHREKCTVHTACTYFRLELKHARFTPD